MIKDKIFEMDNGNNYYVVEEITYNHSKYLLALECDIANDNINKEDYLVMELGMEDGELSIKRIEDNNLAAVVTRLLLAKVRESNN